MINNFSIEVLKMDETKLNKLSYILYSESNDKAVELVKSINSEDELFVLLDNYNWYNGFEVPEVIITHPNCTLPVALLAFHRADGIQYLLEGEAIFANRLSKSWEDFIKEVYDKILKKVGEEATEVVIAAKNEDPQELIYETADVLYHLLVLLAEKNIPYEAIEAELASREGVVSKTTDRPEITNL